MSETVASDSKKKGRRRLKLPWTRANNKSSEAQSTSNGSDRPTAAAAAGEVVAVVRPMDVEAARAKKEASEVRRERWRQRRRNCINFWKRFTSFLLSTIGLTILMIFYTIFGGFVFSWLETPKELTTKHGVKESLQRHVALLWNLTEQMNILHPKNWTAVAEEVVNNYTKEVVKAIKDHGWNGKEDGEDAILQWSFAGSMLYSATVITTIGYGHIAPKTAFGRIATMLYALVGIPLTLLSITHMGGFMATVFRFLYKNIFCGLCCVFCQRRRSMEDNLKTTVVKQQRSFAMHSKPGLSGSSSTTCATTTTTTTTTTIATTTGGNRPTRSKLEVEAETTEKNGTPGGGGGGGVGGGGGGSAGVRVQQSLQRPYKIVVQWRRGIRNALFTDDNQMVHVPIYISLLLICGYIFLGAIMFGLWEEDWGFLIGSYFCFITLSTIGFGDFVPGTSLDPSSSQEKLILCSLYLIFGLALLAMCFDLMQEEARSIFRGIGKRIGLVVTDEVRVNKPLPLPPPVEEEARG